MSRGYDVVAFVHLNIKVPVDEIWWFLAYMTSDDGSVETSMASSP
jgi:hypothetical protein